MGRVQRGGVGFGITVHYGALFIGCGFVIATVVSAITDRPRTRWMTMVLLLIGWSWWVVPALESYPIRGTTFLLLGLTIICLGSGLLVPTLMKTFDAFNTIDQTGGQGM